MIKLVFSPQAKDDLRDILEHIAEFNIAAALKYIDGIEDVCQNILAEFPKVGHTKPEISETYRFFPYRYHLILYHVQHGTLEIARVVHGARDLRNLNR